MAVGYLSETCKGHVGVLFHFADGIYEYKETFSSKSSLKTCFHEEKVSAIEMRVSLLVALVA